MPTPPCAHGGSLCAACDKNPIGKDHPRPISAERGGCCESIGYRSCRQAARVCYFRGVLNDNCRCRCRNEIVPEDPDVLDLVRSRWCSATRLCLQRGQCIIHMHVGGTRVISGGWGGISSTLEFQHNKQRRLRSCVSIGQLQDCVKARVGMAYHALLIICCSVSYWDRNFSFSLRSCSNSVCFSINWFLRDSTTTVSSICEPNARSRQRVSVPLVLCV